METTIRRKADDQRQGVRIRPGFDRLEPRLALSASSFNTLGIAVAPSIPVQAPTMSPLSIVSTTPASLAVLTSTPNNLSVTFDRPIDPFSVGNSDFSLVHVAADGSTTPLGIGEAHITESLDPSDPTDRRIELSLSKGLVPGRYQLQLNPTGQIEGTDGSSTVLHGSTRDVSDFTFRPSQAAPASATDLQTLGSVETVVSGNLDLSNNFGDVDYYKFTVEPGHHWRVGLEISSHRDGGTLDSSISLFNSQGRLISTSNQGLSGDPSDPYLFQGLDPGVYYVGISAQKNIPNSQGVYDPSSAVVGSAVAGGSYQLHLVADPLDQPTRLLGLEVDHADPLSNAPTGLTLQFSAALAVRSLSDPDHPALSLVDQDGKSWPLTPIHYDAESAQLVLSFDQALPSGTYTLEEAGPGSLIDLAGFSPVTQGLAGGLLGSFKVAPSANPSGDLGALYPEAAQSGIDARVTVGAMQSASDQFVVIQPGTYVVESSQPNPGVQLSILDSSGNVVTSGPAASTQGSTYLSLSAGDYRVVLSTTNPQSSVVAFSIRLKVGLNSSLLDSGVSQGPALNLRLVAPQAEIARAAGTSTSTPVAPAVADNSAASTAPQDGGISNSPGRSIVEGSAVAIGQATPSTPSVAGWLAPLGPAGRPDPLANPIGIVGTTGSSPPALASNEGGHLGGLIVVPLPINGHGALVTEAATFEDGHVTDRLAGERTGITLEKGLLARPGESLREDVRTLTNADLVDQLIAGTFDWLEPISRDGLDHSVESSHEADRILVLGDPGDPDENRVETASLASPVGLGLALATIVYHYRRKLFGRSPSQLRPMPKSTARPILAGPHRRSKVRIR